MSVVTPLPSRLNSPNPRDARIKRLAFQLVAQMPDDLDEGLEALEMAKALVRLAPGDLRPV